MAKCVRCVLNEQDRGPVYRVPDALADAAVRSMLWEYTSKGAWKSEGRVKITDRLPGQENWEDHVVQG